MTEWQRRLRDPNSWTPPSPLPVSCQTPRALLRRYQKGDGPALHKAIVSSLDPLLPEMVWARLEHKDIGDTLLVVESELRNNLDPQSNNFAFLLMSPDESEVLGGMGFHRIDRSSLCGDIGYWIRRDMHGKGLCTEAARHLVSWGFTSQSQGGWGFRRITLHCDSINTGSRRIAEKLGFRLEQRCRQERYMDFGEAFGLEKYRDTLGFAALASEWDFNAHCVVGL